METGVGLWRQGLGFGYQMARMPFRASSPNNHNLIKMAKRIITNKRKRFAKRAVKKWVSKRPRSVVTYRPTVAIGRGFPKKLIMTHKYVDNFTLTSTTGGFANYVMTANGIYDPNISGTGHQPMFHDQVAALYNHYIVLGSKCTFKFTPETTTTNTIRVCAFVEDAASLSLSNIDAVSEQVSGKVPKYCTAGNNIVQGFTMKYSAKKYWGADYLAKDDLQGSGANPTEQVYYVLVAVADDVATIAINVTVCIDYIVMWREPKETAQS